MTFLSRAAAAVAGASVLLLSATARAQDEPATEEPASPAVPAAPATSTSDVGEGEPASSPADGDAEDAEEKARRREIVWVRLEGGASYVNMRQFDQSTFQIEKASSAGGVVGLAAGLRLAFLTLGPRFRLEPLSDFTFAQLGGEVGFHIGSARFQPYFTVFGGYSFVTSTVGGSLASNIANAATDVNVRGFNAGLSLGGDYYFAPAISLGFDLSGEALFLKRPPAALPPQFAQLPAAEQQQVLNDPLYKESGSSAGLGVTGTLHVGVHFGI